VASAFRPIAFDTYHERELPLLLAEGRSALAAVDTAGLSPLALCVDGRAYTYHALGDEIRIEAGDARAETVVGLDPRGFAGLVHDLESPASLIYHGEARCLRGDLMHFVRWEPQLRAMFAGRPIYDPARVDLRDRRGAPLDPLQSFALSDPRDDMAHFLRTAGYLWLRSVFSASELEAMREEARELHRRARPGDQSSWWGANALGDSVLCRVLSAGRLPKLGSLVSDARLRDLVALADAPLAPRRAGDLDAVSVLWKNPTMREGLSDLPWHRDCGMGGHAAMCPTLVASVFLEANRPETGALRFLPGSWQTSYRFGDGMGAEASLGVAPPAEPGDLTLHYGDIWHVAPPPTSETGPFRCCALVSFARPDAHNHRGERHYNDVLLGREDGRVASMREMASSRS
jgi:ectoine hydroxylase-related dioxygenase (phytanoyl-CoA dioxygenase family)